MMQRAADAAHSVSYSGRQSFLAYRNGRAIVAQVDVDARAGQGSQVMVNNQTGQQLLKGFTPALISSRVVDDELLDLLERNYRLSGTRGSSVAGRNATVVAATRGDSHSVAARWWIDDATGIVLWQETYDEKRISRPVVRIHLSIGQPRAQHSATSAAAISSATDQHVAHDLISSGTERLGMVMLPASGWPVAGADT